MYRALKMKRSYAIMQPYCVCEVYESKKPRNTPSILEGVYQYFYQEDYEILQKIELIKNDSTSIINIISKLEKTSF